jgi:hypothetical protein
MRSVAQRVAVDIGGWDQEACSNARVIYIETGRDADGVSKANRFGRYVFDALQALPPTISGGAVHFSRALMAELQAILPLKDYYKIYSNPSDIAKSGAIIVSQLGEEVDFPKLLYGRVGNLVPLDDIREALRYFTSATQTVGIYPDALRLTMRDAGGLSGGQRFIPVGYAVAGSLAGPQDGMEPERRMCKWISDYHCDAETNPGPWRAAQPLPGSVTA